MITVANFFFVLFIISLLVIFTVFENKIINKFKKVDLLIGNKITFTDNFRNVSHFLFPRWNINLFNNEKINIIKIIDFYENETHLEETDVVVISVGYLEARSEMSKIEFKDSLLKIIKILKSKKKKIIFTTIPIVLILEAIEDRELKLARDCKEFNEIIIDICNTKKIQLISWDKKVENTQNEELIYKQIFNAIESLEKV